MDDFTEKEDEIKNFFKEIFKVKHKPLEKQKYYQNFLKIKENNINKI